MKPKQPKLTEAEELQRTEYFAAALLRAAKRARTWALVQVEPLPHVNKRPRGKANPIKTPTRTAAMRAATKKMKKTKKTKKTKRGKR
jgi:hypothetical protein